MSKAAPDPCFDLQPAMLGVEEAITALLEQVQPTGAVQQLELQQAGGRVLAAALASPIDVPGFDNSAMDGYAVNSRDAALASSDGLEITGRIPAGCHGDPLQPGCTARIFTGAPLPEGADAVVIQEVCRVENNRMFFDQSISPGENIRPRGNDIAAGSHLLEPGTLLTPPRLGLVASVGMAGVTVYEKLRVAMFSSGDEIVEPGQPLQPGQIYNSNRPLMGALLQQQGCEVIDLGTVPDTFEETRKVLLSAAGQADLVMSSGGVSVGEEDHIKAALEAVGELHLWRIRMKPGKPLAFGKIGRTPFIGLPGNPVSVFVTFILFARPVVWRLQGRADLQAPVFPVTSGFDYQSRQRREYIRVRLTEDPERGPVATPYTKQGSDVLSSVAWADGLVEVPESTRVNHGDSIRYLPFSGWL